MAFYELLYKAMDLLEREGKISYRALQRELNIDAETLDDIKQELILVKKVAREIDDEILVFIPAESAISKEEKRKKSIQPKKDKDTLNDPVFSDSKNSQTKVESTNDTTDLNKNPVQKKHFLKWLGAALVLIGVLLPWYSVNTSGVPGMNQTSSISGLKISQGLLSIAAGIIGGIAGLITKKKPLSLKWLSLLILIAGVVIIGFTLDFIDGASRSVSGPMGMKVRQNPEIGVYITLLGGGLLFLGGLISLLRKKKAVEKV